MRFFSTPFLLAVAAIALLIIGWPLFSERPAERDPAAQQRAAADPLAPRSVATVATAASSVRPAVSPGPAVGTKEYETEQRMRDLCGHGRVDPDAYPASIEVGADRALLRAAIIAEKSGDEYLQAIGYSLHALIAGDAADRGVVAQDPQVCRETALCEDSARTALRGAAAPSENALLKLAQTTTDPRVYAAALRMCHPTTGDKVMDGCNELSLERWAAIDSGNAEPWLLLARGARRRNDAAGVDQAMQMASVASTFDRRTLNYGDVIDWAGLSPGPVKSLAMSKLLAADGRDDLLDIRGYFVGAQTYCRSSDPDAAARRATCNRLIDVLSERSADALGIDVAMRIRAARDDFVSPPQAGDRALLDVYDFLHGAYSGYSGPTPMVRPHPSDTACASTDLAEAWLRGVARHGRVGYAREWLANHPKR